MKTRFIALTAFAVCVFGYHIYSPRQMTGIPADLRDGVAEASLNALADMTRANVPDANIPQPSPERAAARDTKQLERYMDFPAFFALPESAMLPNIYGLTEFYPPSSVLKAMPQKDHQPGDHAQRSAHGGLVGEARMSDPGIPEGLSVWEGPANSRAADDGSPVIYSIHPGNPVGYHIAVVSRAEAAKKLAATGMIQTGDVILTVRPEWGFRGAYPNMMMGVSHAGFAFVDKGMVYNLDHPMGPDYCGNFDSDHYQHSSVLHVIRPRNLTEKQRQNLYILAKKLYDTQPMSGHDLVRGEINFNSEYSKPTYTSNPGFARIVGKVALGYKDEGVKIFCSEFVWALLSLKNCDLQKDAADFKAKGAPACISAPFNPMAVLGDYFLKTDSQPGHLGFFDGPLSVINSMGLPKEEKEVLIHTVFKKLRPKDTDSESLYSEGPAFDRLEEYYAGVESKTPAVAALINGYNSKFERNYPPVAYLVNTLLPVNSPERVMDVVGTVVFSD
ncbi:MAG TPA: hypothetical protein DCL44_03430 [Elusimicrobia bacterium]|nr:hypothetical protein [Elusimicrobiota bacterium]